MWKLPRPLFTELDEVLLGAKVAIAAEKFSTSSKGGREVEEASGLDNKGKAAKADSDDEAEDAEGEPDQA